MTESPNGDDVPLEDRIESALRDDPTATHQELADRVGCSRSYVSDIFSERGDLRALRDAYRDGIEIDGASRSAVRVISSLKARAEEAGVDEYVANELHRAAVEGRLDVVRLEVEPKVDEE